MSFKPRKRVAASLEGINLEEHRARIPGFSWLYSCRLWPEIQQGRFASACILCWFRCRNHIVAGTAGTALYVPNLWGKGRGAVGLCEFVTSFVCQHVDRQQTGYDLVFRLGKVEDSLSSHIVGFN